jgi:hypothetical protein
MCLRTVACEELVPVYFPTHHFVQYEVRLLEVEHYVQLAHALEVLVLIDGKRTRQTVRTCRRQPGCLREACVLRCLAVISAMDTPLHLASKNVYTS